MSGWRLRSSGIIAGAAASMALAACGSGARQDVNEPSGHYNVEVATASFPTSQSLAQRSHMVISVRNADSKTIPDVAVTITDASYGTSAQAFGESIASPGQSNPTEPLLANPSRPVWIVDQGPAPHGCQFSCAAGGPGGAVTAYSNTWALGALAPGRSATFQWTLTAVKSGTHVVHYRVAAGLNGRSIAQLAGGQPPEGTFTVTVHAAPAQSYVNNAGQVVTKP